MMEGHNMDIREGYEQARLNGYLSILPHVDSKKTRSLTPQKLFPFGWEKQAKTELTQITNEDLEYFDKLEAIINEGRLIPKKKNG
jgi:hypothetical protein